MKLKVESHHFFIHLEDWGLKDRLLTAESFNLKVVTVYNLFIMVCKHAMSAS